MKTVIEMARDAGGRAQQNKNCDVEYLMDAEALERFAELVRAAERKQIIAKNAPEIERINAYIKTLEESVATQARSNT